MGIYLNHFDPVEPHVLQEHVAPLDQSNLESVWKQCWAEIWANWASYLFPIWSMQSHLSFNIRRDGVDKSFSLKEAEDLLERDFLKDGNMLYQ